MSLPVVGDQFEGRYRIDAILGVGGFATVFRAEDMVLHRAVALKVLEPNPHAHPGGVVKRFELEAELVGQLTHPNTVRLYHHGVAADGMLFMALELVEGAELADRLANGQRLTPTVAVHICRQVLSALTEAHGVGALHRDIKPANILLREVDGDPFYVKVVDFGIAKLVDTIDGVPQLTATGAVVGTPHYMSPEQMLGGQVDETSDVFSAGLVLLECLVGRTFMLDWKRESLTRFFAPTADPRYLPESIGPGWLRRAIEAMTDGSPAARPSSASDALSLLRQPTNDPVAPVSRAPSSPRTRPVVAHQPTTGSNRGRGPIAGIAIAALVGVGAAVAFALFAQPGVTPSPTPRAHPDRTALVKQPPTPKPALPDRADASHDVGSATDVGPSTPAARTSLGCGKSPPRESGTVDLSVGIEAVTVHIPRTYDQNVAHPVVVLFHQDARTGREFIGQTGFDKLADEKGFVVVAPDYGVFIMGGKQRQMLAPDAIAAAADELCMDPRRIYLVGHGYGGIAVEKFACEPWVTATATNNFRRTTIRRLCRPNRPVPHMLFAALHSQRIPVNGKGQCGRTKQPTLAEHEAVWSDNNACSPQRRTVFEHAGSTCYAFQGCEMPLWSCHLNGGYRWPGSRAAEIDITGCEDNSPYIDFPGTEKIWEFFEAAPPSEPSVIAPWD